MRLITEKCINFFQSDLLRENNFLHAFFTKRSNNKPIELQNELNLFSNIHYAQQIHSDNVIQVNNTLNLKPHIRSYMFLLRCFICCILILTLEGWFIKF